MIPAMASDCGFEAETTNRAQLTASISLLSTDVATITYGLQIIWLLQSVRLRSNFESVTAVRGEGDRENNPSPAIDKPLLSIGKVPHDERALKEAYLVDGVMDVGSIFGCSHQTTASLQAFWVRVYRNERPVEDIPRKFS